MRLQCIYSAVWTIAAHKAIIRGFCLFFSTVRGERLNFWTLKFKKSQVIINSQLLILLLAGILNDLSCICLKH